MLKYHPSMKLFVWDFHGVLEKGNELAVIEISNKVLEDSGYKERFSQKDIFKLYGMKWYEYFEYLLPKLSHNDHLKLQQDCFTFAEKNIQIIADIIKPNNHSHEVIKKIKNAGHEQMIISNTRANDLSWFIKSVELNI